ncbi:unnamed protein product, partial [Phaeothamnion confervicola]
MRPAGAARRGGRRRQVSLILDGLRMPGSVSWLGQVKYVSSHPVAAALRVDAGLGKERIFDAAGSARVCFRTSVTEAELGYFRHIESQSSFSSLITPGWRHNTHALP